MTQTPPRRRSELAEIEAIYRTAPIGLCVIDRDLRFVRINERLAEINGFPVSEHIGRTVSDILPDLAKRVEPLFRQVIKTGVPVLGLELQGETPAQPGVRRVWIENYIPLRDASGRVFGVNVSVEEVTELRRLEEERSRQAHVRALAQQDRVRAHRLTTLARLNRLVSSSLDLDETLTAITMAANELMAAASSSVWIADEVAGRIEQRISGPIPFSVDQLHFGEGLVGWAAQHRRILNVPDVIVDPRTIKAEWFRASALRSILAIPIVHGESLLGVLALVGARPFTLDADTQELLDSFVAQTTMAIRNARLYRDVEQRRREAETLVELARALGTTLDLDTVLRQAVEAARDLLESDCAQIALRDPDTNVMVMRYSAPETLARSFEDLRIEKGKGVGGLAWTLRRPVRTDNQPEDPKLTRDYDAIVRAEGIVAVMAAPIVIGDEVEGLLYVDNLSSRSFTQHGEAVLAGLALHAAIAIQNAQLFRQIQSSSERLTALSRRLLEVQETERRHIARELHDEIGQALTALKLNLEALGLSSPASLSSRFEETMGIADGVMERARDLSVSLRPSILDDLGLTAAVRWYVRREADRARLEADLDFEPFEPRAAPEIETTCFRIVQEAVTNAIRHAKAGRLCVRLSCRDGALEVTIRDDGVGFDVGHARLRAVHGESLGLVGLQERATLVGGRIEIVSALGDGTEIRARLPLTVNGAQ
jgi:PAS domain S-box-containing protein